MSRLDVRTGAVAGFLVGVLPGIAAAQCAGEDYASYIHRLGVLDTPGQAKAITSSGSIAYVGPNKLDSERRPKKLARATSPIAES